MAALWDTVGLLSQVLFGTLLWRPCGAAFESLYEVPSGPMQDRRANPYGDMPFGP